jgi:hypothetical protein
MLGLELESKLCTINPMPQNGTSGAVLWHWVSWEDGSETWEPLNGTTIMVSSTHTDPR